MGERAGGSGGLGVEPEHGGLRRLGGGLGYVAPRSQLTGKACHNDTSYVPRSTWRRVNATIKQLHDVASQRAHAQATKTGLWCPYIPRKLCPPTLGAMAGALLAACRSIALLHVCPVDNLHVRAMTGGDARERVLTNARAERHGQGCQAHPASMTVRLPASLNATVESHLPNGFQVVGAHVLVLQVVRVLPHIDAQQRDQPLQTSSTALDAAAGRLQFHSASAPALVSAPWPPAGPGWHKWPAPGGRTPGCSPASPSQSPARPQTLRSWWRSGRPGS